MAVLDDDDVPDFNWGPEEIDDDPWNDDDDYFTDYRTYRESRDW